MLITKYFVFLHVPKTGGLFVKEICGRFLPPDWFVPNTLHDHNGLQAIPPEYGHLPILSFVRNPWDWYVSWFHYATQDLPRPSWLWSAFLDGGRSSFENAVVAACTGCRNGTPLAPPRPPGPQWWRAMQELDADYYTAMHWLITGQGVDKGRVQVGRFESLRRDLANFFLRNDIPVGEDLLKRIEHLPPSNESQRGPYKDYYDDDLRQVVAARARLLISSYGYSF